MLNLVPIQFLALYGYAILRIIVGLVWLDLALRHKTEANQIATYLHIPFFPWSKTAVFLIVTTELLIGGLFILGLATQIAAAISVVWCLKLLFFRRYFTSPSFPDNRTTILLLAIGLCLFITGAGALAFDLPV